jgi:ABC-type sugar transport system ATPase subunit
VAQITLRDVEVHYSEASPPALSIKELSIASGEVLAVVGVSGSGKSTLLRAIAGFVRDVGRRRNGWSLLSRFVRTVASAHCTGQVLFDGNDVTDLPPRERRIALASQSLNLYPHFTVAENLGFPLRMAGLPPQVRTERVRETAEKLQITPLLQRRPSELSGGEQQRVAVGKALVQDASVFLFDEPFSSLDAPLRMAFGRDLALWLRQVPRTTLYVTHDIEEAFLIADRVAVLHRGELLQVATPSELYRSPATIEVARLVWGGRMQLVPGEFPSAEGGGCLRLGEEVVTFPRGRESAKGSVWAVFPREALRIENARNGTDGFHADVTGVRFGGATHIVSLATAGLAVEVAVPHEPPLPGTRVWLSLDVDMIQVYPRTT